MNLLLCNGFNYYNRIVKKYDTYTDYYQFMDANAPIIENHNFNPNDGINTTIIVNWDYKTPDYIVAVDSMNTINSRWFVVDATRTRAGQLQLELHRDVLVDYYNNIKDAPMYIEKATINTPTDVAMYNQENISFNSIKKSESLLKDSTGVPWVIGYMARKISSGLPANIVTPSITSYDIFGEYSSQQDLFTQIGYNGTSWKKITDITQYVFIRSYDTYTDISYQLNVNSQTKTQVTNASYGYRFQNVIPGKIYDNLNSVLNGLNANLSNINDNYILTNDSYHLINPWQYSSKYVIIGTGANKALYQIRVTYTGNGNINEEFPGTSTFGTYVKTIIQNSQTYGNIESFTGKGINTTAKYENYTITLTQITRDVYKTTLTTSMKQLTDAPYRMFAIPLEKITVRTGYSTTFNTLDNRNDVLNIASTIATEIGGTDGFLYDIQLLPFFPMINDTTYWNNGELRADNLTKHVDYEFITDDNETTNVGIIVFPSLSKFSFNISKALTLPSTIEDRKVVNQCDTYRICSPNYASIFEFNLLKTGSITTFNVDCTYKPYSPYIHVNPVWGNLYGEDYDDIRGLICQGDFSLPIINDQWINYQINNKNYLNSFNRQIDSLELQNKYAKQQDIVNAVVGTASGAVTGAAMTGNVAGAVGGGLLSGAAGIYDVAINEKLRNESLDLTKDQFNYSLDNIQSLPNTLARVGAFDYNNKLFPILEYYSCTDQEKNIFKDKMKYNGMTIMRVDKIENFATGNKNYIKGKLIRCESLDEATHEFNTLANELNKGAYF